MSGLLKRLLGKLSLGKPSGAVRGEILRKRIEQPEEPLIPRGFKVVERYSIYEPFAHAVIVQNPETGETRYVVDELKLTRRENFIYQRVVETLQWELKPLSEVEDPYNYFKSMARKVVHKYRLRLGKLPGISWSKILYYVERNLLGYGPIDPLMRDPNLEDISCDGVGKPVYVWHRRYESIPTNIVFKDHQELDEFIIRLAHKAGKHISIAWPILDAMLPEMHRLAATFSREVSTSGSTFTIRKFREDPITIIDMINFKTLDAGTAAYLWIAMEYKMPAMIMGVTGSGKTTLLNSLTCMFRPTIKVVSIEDTPELRLPLDNWVQLVSRPSYGMGPEKVGEVTLFDLVKVSLRYRPDIIIVGEVRGEEAYVLFQALASVSGDTPVLIRGPDGKVRLVEIGEFVDQFYSEGEERIAKRVEGFEVLSHEGFRAVWKPVKYVLRHSIDKIYRVVVESGAEIRATGSHSVFVADPETLEIREKPVEEIKPGELLVTYTEAPLQRRSTRPIIRTARYLGRKVGATIVEVSTGTATLLVRGGGHRLPGSIKLDEDLAYVFGVYIADGCVKHYRGSRICLTLGNKEDNIASRVTEIFWKKFGVKPTVTRRRTYTIYEYNHTLLAELFEKLMGSRLEEKHVPEPLWEAPTSVVRAFFEGLRADSRRTLKRRYINYSTANKRLARELVWLARLHGWYSTMHIEKGTGKNRGKQYYNVNIYFDKYHRRPNVAERIPVRPLLKLAKLAGARSMPFDLTYVRRRKYVPRKVVEKLLQWITSKGRIEGDAAELYRRILDYMNGKLRVVEVRRIEVEDYKGYVYDLSVPGTESFFGGNTPVLLHNTGHGGVCLPGDQLVLAKVNGKIDLYEIEDIAEGVLRGRYKEVKVYTVENGKPVWRDVPRVVIKGGTQRFVRIYAEGGVVHEVHEDHKVVVYRDGGLETKKARELRKGDLLVSILTPPVKPELKYLDVLELLKEKYVEKLYVKGASPALRRVPKTSIKAVGGASASIDDWKYRGVAVPLKIVEALGLTKNPEIRDALRVKYGGKARSSIPAKLPLNEDLGFIIGFFLADGSMMYDYRDKLPRRCFFALGRSDKDEKPARELVAALKRLGIDANAVYIRKSRGYYQVHVDSKIFAITLYELLEGRVSGHDRAVPLDLALRAPEEFRKGIVKGFWLGDGSAFIDGKGRLRMYASISSRKLAESLVLLMKTLGIHASLKPVDNSRGFGTKSSVVYMITVLGGQSKKIMARILGITPPRKSYTKVKRYGGLLLHRVVRTELVEKDSLLYDLEVPDLHIYAISGGMILTHNTTIHAESVDAAVKRLTSPPMNIPEGYIPLMKLGIIVKRVRVFSPDYPAGRIARRVSGVYEIKDVGRYEPVVQWNPFKDTFDKRFRDSMVLREISESIGRTYDELIEEMSRRSVVLQWMAWRGIRDYREVARVVQAYYANPEKVFKHAEEELAQRPGF